MCMETIVVQWVMKFGFCVLYCLKTCLKLECFLAARTIKQEEGTEEETERRPNGPDEAGHSGEEGSGLEEPMIDSPNNLQDGGPGTEAQSETGIRLPNGKYNGKY